VGTRRISANIAKLRELLKSCPPFKGIALSRKPPVEKRPRRGSKNHRGLCTRGTGVGLWDTPGHTTKTVPRGC
jgi:hypothetical protein